MRKLVFVLVLLLLLAAQIGQAATLDSSWYVQLNWVDVYNYRWDPINRYYYKMLYQADFSIPVGPYGPFLVTNPGASPGGARYVTVPATSQATSADSLIIPFTTTGGLTNAYLSFSCYTNYDPTQMYVSLWQVMGNGGDVLLWSQLNGGPRAGGPDIYQPITSQDYYFKVTVVPEPSSASCMAAAFLSLIGLKARKRR